MLQKPLTSGGVCTRCVLHSLVFHTLDVLVRYTSCCTCVLYSLISIIWTYKTSLVSGALFFFVAISGASAMVALFVGGMFATAVGGVYLVAQSSHARLENGRNSRSAPRHVRYERYEHYD